MALLVICALIGVAIGIWSAVEGNDSKLFSGLLLGVVGAALGFVLVLAATELLLPAKYSVVTNDYNDRIELVALSNTSGLHGDFFLGSGQINSVFYYVYRFKTDRGSERFSKVEMEKSDVFKEDRKGGYIINIHKITKPSLDYEKSFWKWITIAPGEDLIIWHDIHVPKGSVKDGIDIDIGKL
jgi:hypothetical protein